MFITCWRFMEAIKPDGLITRPLYVFVFLILIALIPIMIIVRFAKFNTVEYELLNEKIFIPAGILGSTSKVFRLSNVKKIEVNRGLQRLVNACTIRFYTDTKEVDVWTRADKNYEE